MYRLVVFDIIETSNTVVSCEYIIFVLKLNLISIQVVLIHKRSSNKNEI